MMRKAMVTVILMSVSLLTGCATEQTRDVRTGKPFPASPQSNYDIGLSKYQVNIFGKYKVSHAYLSGTNITPCYVGAPAEDVRLVMMRFDDGGVVPGYVRYWKGERRENPLDLQIDGTARTNTVNGKVRHWMDFSSVCGSWTPGGAITLGIRNAERQTIDQNIDEATGRIAMYPHGRLDPPKKVMHGKNQWTYLHSFVPIPPADTNEEWFLPIGNSGYYYYLAFGYRHAMRAANAPAYQFTRRLFDQMLDSFVVEELGIQK